jgi:eukaryotic-like serine/threonine-protein kinase
VVRCPDESVLVAMADRSVDPEQFAALEAHIDECADCRRLLGAAVAGHSLAQGSEPRDEIEPLAAFIDTSINGRYQIVTELGRGGMGAVFLAHDRTLDREVALKLHRAGSGNDRLHREALAMAKLAHPNVVTVFEVASVDDRMYVAMEYVRGQTLRGWLAAAPRGWREIVQLLVEVGGGLAAAHAAGLVHRDFKPENVLVGDDGRPRVGDFGLARVGFVEGDAPLATSPMTLATPTTPMTATGALLGTPAYMAPEQIAGEAVDARSDQFAFCVVAWECIYGSRPFVGTTLAGLHAAMLRNELVSPARSDVPPRVREVIARGLALDPAARFADMTALLAALRTAASPRTKRRWLFPLVLAVCGATALGAFAVGSKSEGPACSTGEKRLVGIWDADKRRVVADAIRATKSAYAAGVADSVLRDLDTYANAWRAMHLEACQATHARGEQSYVLLDRRMECLDRRRTQLGALTDLLARADDAVVQKASQAVRALPTLDVCADRNALLATISPPENATTRKRIDEHRQQLAAVEALRIAGKYKEALAQAAPLAQAARELGYRPFEAEAVYTLALLQDHTGDTRATEATLYEALRAAEAGRELDMAAEIWSTLVNTVGARLDRTDEADRLAGLADAAAERAGRPARLEMRLARALANVRVKQGRVEDAIVLFRKAIELGTGAVGADDPFVARMMQAEATQLENLGKYEEALARYEQVRVIVERVQGREHPDLAVTIENIGIAKGRLGHHADALADLTAALALAERGYGSEHRIIAEILDETGLVHLDAGDPAAALPLMRRGVAIAERVLGPEHTATLSYRGHVAMALKRQGKLDEAWPLLVEVSKLEEKVRGPEHPRLAATLQNLGSLALDRKDAKSAITYFSRALPLFEKAYGADAPRVGAAKFGLAQALCNAGRDRKRAVQLATHAREIYVAIPGGAEDPETARIQAWLDTYGPHGR